MVNEWLCFTSTYHGEVVALYGFKFPLQTSDSTTLYFRNGESKFQRLSSPSVWERLS